LLDSYRVPALAFNSKNSPYDGEKHPDRVENSSFVPVAPEFLCNLCDRPLLVNELGFACRLCDFDLCAECHEARLRAMEKASFAKTDSPQWPDSSSSSPSSAARSSFSSCDLAPSSSFPSARLVDYSEPAGHQAGDPVRSSSNPDRKSASRLPSVDELVGCVLELINHGNRSRDRVTDRQKVGYPAIREIVVEREKTNCNTHAFCVEWSARRQRVRCPHSATLCLPLSWSACFPSLCSDCGSLLATLARSAT
jgi:hypothetical protein